jgi:hypothetical protein
VTGYRLVGGDEFLVADAPLFGMQAWSLKDNALRVWAEAGGESVLGIETKE